MRPLTASLRKKAHLFTYSSREKLFTHVHKTIEFHDVVLRDGAVPLAVLEETVDAWLAGKKA